MMMNRVVPTSGPSKRAGAADDHHTTRSPETDEHITRRRIAPEERNSAACDAGRKASHDRTRSAAKQIDIKADQGCPHIIVRNRHQRLAERARVRRWTSQKHQCDTRKDEEILEVESLRPLLNARNAEVGSKREIIPSSPPVSHFC